MRNHKTNIAAANQCLIFFCCQPVFDPVHCVCVCVCAPVFDPVHRDIVAEHGVDDLGQLVRVVDCRVQRELLKETRMKSFIGPSREKHSIEMF